MEAPSIEFEILSLGMGYNLAANPLIKKICISNYDGVSVHLECNNWDVDKLFQSPPFFIHEG